MNSSSENLRGFSIRPSTSNCQVARSIGGAPCRSRNTAEQRQLTKDGSRRRFSQDEIRSLSLDEDFYLASQDECGEISLVAFLQQEFAGRKLLHLPCIKKSLSAINRESLKQRE